MFNTSRDLHFYRKLHFLDMEYIVHVLRNYANLLTFFLEMYLSIVKHTVPTEKEEGYIETYVITICNFWHVLGG